MLRVKTLYCCLFVALTCFFTNSSYAVEKIPTPGNNSSYLDRCLVFESGTWRDIPLPEKNGQAHCKVESIIIQVFQGAWRAHKKLPFGQALLNASLSGKTAKRGRNLLTFAAFNGFSRLAFWGALNGSDINQGDADMTTFLGTAIADNQPYMANFGLLYLKANPNTVYGEEDRQLTALRDATNHFWPVDAIAALIENGAVVRNQTEYEFIQSYLIHMAGSDDRNRLKAGELIYTLYSAGSLGYPGRTYKPATIYTDTLEEIDRHLLYAIEHNHLTQEEIDAFQIHGRNFYHFLAFNGFNQTIQYLLRYGLAPEFAKEAVALRSKTGYDMLLAAIHGNNADAVREILKISDLSVNLKVPSFGGYENRGKKPLDLAREWQASPEVIKVLLRNGATLLIR